MLDHAFRIQTESKFGEIYFLICLEPFSLVVFQNWSKCVLIYLYSMDKHCLARNMKNGHDVKTIIINKALKLFKLY